jgi:four helix bundle suffix protein
VSEGHYDKEKTVNIMITLINQANYLQDKLISSLEEKHMKEGGFTEKLYKKRVEYRQRYGKR